jgi:hypothetical protein
VLQRSRLGVVRDDADFTTGLSPTANYSKRAAKLEKVDDRYELLTSKRRQQRLSREPARLRAADRLRRAHGHRSAGVERRLRVPLRVSGDDAAVHKISREMSSFNFLAGTRGWLQPIAPARSGWNECESFV